MKFDQQFVDGTNNMAKFMLDMKSIKSVPKFNSYVDTSAMKKLFPAEVTVE